MTLLTYPMQDNFETKLSQARNGATGTVYVQTTPSFTMPASSFTVVTVDPGTDKEQAFIMDSFNTSAKTLNCYSISVDKGPSLAYTQQSHSVGAKVIISNNYRNRKKLKDEIDAKAGLTDTNAFSGTNTFVTVSFTGTSTAGLTVKSLTTVQRDALTPSNGAIIYNTTAGEFQIYQGGAWSTVSSGSTQPNASTTVAGKVEAPTQAEVEQLATTGGTGALVFVTPTTINPSSITSASPASGDKLSFSDVSDSNYLKSSTLADVIALVKANLFGFGTDGDVTIVGTVTLTRDMYYNNLIIPVGTTLDPNGYRIFVAGTISGTGTISRNGNSGANAVGKTGAAAATTLNQGSLNAEVAAGAGGTGGNPGAATAGTAGTSASPSMVNTNGVAGGAGGNGGAGGAGGTSTRGANYLALFPFATLHPATAGTITYENYKSISGSGGGGGGYGQGGGSPYDGSGGGGGGGNGGFIWIAAYTWNFTGTITATGGAGGNGADGVVGGGGGGGGGGNGGTILRIYRTMVSDCTKTLTGGNGGTGGAAGSSQPAGANGSNGSTGVTIDIQI